MKYPKEIYWDKFVPGIDPYRQKRFLVERAYDMDKADAKNLDGYSNMTEAIKAGEPIDWERLDGLVTKCVHPTLGSLLYPLEVDGNGRKVIWNNEGNFWFTANGGKVWAEALREAWDGQNGWTLWLEGEIPMRRKTADQLEVGTYFTGKMGAGGGRRLYVGKNVWEDRKAIFYAPNMLKSPISPSKWVVLEEYGTFQKPEGK